MSACFVTQDSDVCTFRHTGQGVKHKPGRKIVLPLYLSFSFFLCIFVVVLVAVYTERWYQHSVTSTVWVGGG